jgi:predicted RNA-binding protein with TRAM domain
MRSVKNRRSLTPDIGVPAAGAAHSVRRGGNRHELTERIRFVGKNMKMREGWALNVSRGGVRAILEENVELGEEFEVTIGEEGDAGTLTRKGRVVWVQDEPDGVIVGFEFLLSTGAHPAVREPSADGSGTAPAVHVDDGTDPKPDD